MSPEQVSALTALATILAKVGTWPIGTVLVGVVFGPYVIMSVQLRAMEKRHEAALEMYKHNVKLVECYEAMAREQADTIRLATAATVELTTYLKQQVPCYQRINERFGPK